MGIEAAAKLLFTTVLVSTGLLRESRAQALPAPSSESPQLNTQELDRIEVTGTRATSSIDVPQSIDTIDSDAIAQQHLTRLTDALRNVPGITLNSGEGGSHGDSVNLRGLSVPDSFFLDGLRDIGQYGRDTFNQEQISVLLGPSSTLFGRGSTAGVINSVSKRPELEDEYQATVSVGSAGLTRGTADLNQQLNDNAALRLNLMGEHAGVVERDDVVNRRSGIAPSLVLGLGTETRISVTLLDQSENNVPDYGIPFVSGKPAPVERSNFYGLANFDRTDTQTDIVTARFEHDFDNEVSLVNTLRAARYGFAFILSGPHLNNDFTDAPSPGETLSNIPVYRDQPSSTGTITEVISRTDVSEDFHFGPMTHALLTGVELSRETTEITRDFNGIDIDPPTSILTPNPYNAAPTPLVGVTFPHDVGTDVSIYATDQISVTRQWDVDLGLRFDRFNSYFAESASGTSFNRTDSEFSPRLALVYKPSGLESYYISYGTSYNPGIEYLVFAPSNQSLAPERDRTSEVGAKLSVLERKLLVSANIFDSHLDNARNADPDDPLIQQQPFNQSVLGFEVAAQGTLTEHLSMLAGYAHLNSRITAAYDPLAQGKQAPNSPHDAVNLWLQYKIDSRWQVGGGADYTGHRFADTQNTASVPSYVVANLMTSWQFDKHLTLQVNLNNISNKLYYGGIYYSSPVENHAVPGPGRTLIASIDLHF